MGRINDPATGGTVEYYLMELRHPRRQAEPCVFDVDDLSAVLKPTPEEFNILKAIVRSCNARLGNGKPDYDDLDARIRDAKKMVHYSGCNLKILEDERSDMVQRDPLEVMLKPLTIGPLMTGIDLANAADWGAVANMTPPPEDGDIDPDDPDGNWLNNVGRVPNVPEVVVQMKNGDTLKGKPETFNWRLTKNQSCILRYRVV